MADEEVAVSLTSASSAPVTVHDVVVGPVSPLKTSITKNSVNYRVKIRLRLQMVSLSLLRKSIMLSSSSESLLSSFLTFHVPGHINTYDIPCNTAFYCVASIYAMLVHTMELAFYHSPSVHATLVHTMATAFCR